MKAFNKALESAPKYIMNCPVAFEWWEYKGETFFAGLNYERSLESGRPMIDLHHCATRALNGLVIRTVQYDKRKFSKSKLNQ